MHEPENMDIDIESYCYICQTTEHTDYDCDRGCIICQTLDHDLKDCKNCMYCKNENAGHTARYCEQRLMAEQTGQKRTGQEKERQEQNKDTKDIKN